MEATSSATTATLAHHTTLSDDASQPLDPSSVFTQLSTYPFESDLEFQSGLASIFGHPNTPATADEVAQSQQLILQAQCFYFSRSAIPFPSPLLPDHQPLPLTLSLPRKLNLLPPIDPSAYATWLQQSDPPPTTNGTISRPPSTSLQPPAEEQAQAPYPSSFEHIVSLITTGQPIPGIETIPDTVLEGQDQPSVKARRKKPWERDGQGTSAAEGGAVKDVLPEQSAAVQAETVEPAGRNVEDSETCGHG